MVLPVYYLKMTVDDHYNKPVYCYLDCVYAKINNTCRHSSHLTFINIKIKIPRSKLSLPEDQSCSYKVEELSGFSPISIGQCRLRQLF